MTKFLIYVVTLGLVAQAFIGLLFFVSSIREKERRASFFAGLQFLGMVGLLILFCFLAWIRLFDRGIGLALLVAGIVFAAFVSFLLIRKTPPNKRALKGSKGFITEARLRAVHIIL